MPNHGLQCGVLVLQRPLGHHLLLVMVHRQSIRHLLYVLPQRGDGLPYQEQDYQPDDGIVMIIQHLLDCPQFS